MPIVLSYSRIDEQAVKALTQGLLAARRDVWFDHDLAGGDAWWDSILENIRSATVFIFALSDASLASKPCRLELDYAIAVARPIVPVQVGPVASLRANPLAELQIIAFRPDEGLSGFTVLAAVDDAARRVRPLPDPLPSPPPIPFEYLMVLGRQIDGGELTQNDQIGIVDQLRRALDEETDPSVRQDILSMLRNLNSKPWTTKRIERDISALLYAHDPESRPRVSAEADSVTPPPPAPDDSEPGQPESLHQELDPREWFAERLELLQRQQAAENATQANRVPSRPPSNPTAPWKPTLERDEHSWFKADTLDSPTAPEPTSPSPSAPPSPPRAPSYFAASAANDPTQQVSSKPTNQLPPTPHWAPESDTHTVPSPPTYWAMSIISFLLSLLFGGIAMYFSYQVGRRYRAGDMAAAQKASVNAKIWGIVGIVVGGLALVIAFANT